MPLGDTYLGQTPPKPHKLSRALRVINLAVLATGSWCLLAGLAFAMGFKL